ncbi:amino acid/amide ABC transporter membrane protein 2, HAAT family [Arthrobacter crystallopoietes]|uniref:Amino acid/amide ABC transporter membrane protein 2, HAAT family n=1 Tax=Crystallibacter crystallopoietes TaxID=37928 RepID=A0A1H1CVA3_9MICC|nr:branched-chain amino acid ABC transporter permease [Arthrobacter crystallopoietes]SDQ67818.1 amino acid/amide ABC transporter membrane protein 2, HAAT family [Arthrobacter crystallopoietes]
MPNPTIDIASTRREALTVPVYKRSRGIARPVPLLIAGVVLLIAPLYVSAFWLQLGFTISALAVGAIGLNLLTGTTGQLSLAHPFFMGVGALAYVVLSGESQETSLGPIIGLGLPPLLGMIGGVLLAGLAGLLFSPVSARLQGIYLGVSSLALVFIGLHVLNTVSPLSGGFNGRSTPAFEVLGLRFDHSDNPVTILGVPFGRAELLWYLGIVLLVLAYWFARNLLKSRPGRAMKLVADSQLAASVMGVPVMQYKGKVFFASSVYAGLAGVMYALAIGSIAPQSFGMDLSMQFLAMIVIGGLGSVGGAIAGAAFVTSLPLVIQNLSEYIPFVSNSPGGMSASHLASYIYGAAVILVLIFKPSGLAGIWESAVRLTKRRRPGTDKTHTARRGRADVQDPTN